MHYYHCWAYSLHVYQNPSIWKTTWNHYRGKNDGLPRNRLKQQQSKSNCMRNSLQLHVGGGNDDVHILYSNNFTLWWKVFSIKLMFICGLAGQRLTTTRAYTIYESNDDAVSDELNHVCAFSSGTKLILKYALAWICESKQKSSETFYRAPWGTSRMAKG